MVVLGILGHSSMARAQSPPTEPAPAPSSAPPPSTLALPPATPEAPPQPGAKTLRLDEVVGLALTRNERTPQADLRLEVADAAVSRARSGFLPTITVAGNDTQRPYTVENKGVVTQPSNIATATATVNQPLLNAPAWPLYRAAQRDRNAQEHQTAEDKRVLMFDAARSFFVALNQEDVLRAAQRRLDYAKASLATTQARVDAQLNSSNDVTRATLEMASSLREVANDQGGVQKAYLSLSYVTNTRIAAGPLAPPDATLRAARVQLGATEPMIEAALARRLSVAATHEHAAAAHLLAEEPPLRFVPVVGLQGQFRLTSDSGTSGRWADETLALTMTWTIYDAGVRFADKRSRDASAKIADLDHQIARRSVDNDVRVAVAALTSAQAAYKVSEDAVVSAKKSSVETQVLYRQGLAKAIELIDAATNLFVAEVSLAEAELTMAQAYLDLRFSLGLDPLGTELR